MQELLRSLEMTEEVTDSMYRNTEILLDLYRKVEFKVKRNMEDIDEELYIDSRKHLTDLLHEMIDFDSTVEKQRIQERLASNDLTLCLMEIMEDALISTKEYPDKGEMYYRLIRYRYFDSMPATNEDLMEIMSLSRSTYYRQKKQAIRLYAAMLWMYTDPKRGIRNINMGLS